MSIAWTFIGAAFALAASAPEEARGPALEGRVVDEKGQPLPGARIILYAGVATRWKCAETQTGDDGRYRFDSVQSSMIKDEKTGRWDQHVGLRVEHPTHVEADGRSWRDLTIPGVAGHVETLNLKLTPAGHIDGLLKEAPDGKPITDLDLRALLSPNGSGRRSDFHVYAKTDDGGRFHSLSLFPGEYELEVNSSTLDYPLIGRVKVEPGKTTAVTFDKVALPKVVEGVVLDAAGKPLDGVEVTLLAPEHSGVQLRSKNDFMNVRSRAWAITRPKWQERFQLAFLHRLEQSRFVLAAHETGWSKVSVESLQKGEPIRLQAWEPK
jgi:protocatechuate 3,4-dioxygenase beta subunit